MRISDVIGLGLSALWQQKVRTSLTTLGVVIGTFLLVLSLAIGQGVKVAVLNELRRFDQVRKVLVYPGTKAKSEHAVTIKGDVGEAKRERLRQAILRREQGKPSEREALRLTPERVQELAKLEHVESAVPNWTRPGYVTYRGKEVSVTTVAAEHENRAYKNRIVAGSFLPSDAGDTIVVSEYLLYRWGVVEDEAVEATIGQTVLLEHPNNRPGAGNLLALLNAGRASMSAEEGRVLDKAIAQLPAALAKTDLTRAEKKVLARLLAGAKPDKGEARVVRRRMKIVGVIRDPTREERLSGWEGLLTTFDAIVPAKTAEEMFFSVPGNKGSSFAQVTVRVDDEENLKGVQKKIGDMGHETYSLAEVIDQVRFNVLIVSFLTAFMAVVALVVAGLGITNTMLMSVLERTREIGVMKAVGARDRHVLGLFLVEGALIGAVGGGLGVLLSWLASFPGDRVAKALVGKHAGLQFEGSLFLFSGWLLAGAPLLVSALTILSAVYPARRAARVNPIAALRHE